MRERTRCSLTTPFSRRIKPSLTQHGYLWSTFVMSTCFLDQQGPQTSRPSRKFETRLEVNFSQQQVRRICRFSCASCGRIFFGNKVSSGRACKLVFSTVIPLSYTVHKTWLPFPDCSEIRSARYKCDDRPRRSVLEYGQLHDGEVFCVALKTIKLKLTCKNDATESAHDYCKQKDKTASCQEVLMEMMTELDGPKKRNLFSKALERCRFWILVRGNREGRCRWSARFHRDLLFPSPLRSSAAPYTVRFTPIGSQNPAKEFELPTSNFSTARASAAQRSTATRRCSSALDENVPNHPNATYPGRWTGRADGHHCHQISSPSSVLFVATSHDPRGRWGHGGSAVRTLASDQGDPGLIPDRDTPDFRMWESCRTRPLVGWFSRISPVSPPFHSGAVPYLNHPHRLSRPRYYIRFRCDSLADAALESWRSRAATRVEIGGDRTAPDHGVKESASGKHAGRRQLEAWLAISRSSRGCAVVHRWAIIIEIIWAMLRPFVFTTPRPVRPCAHMQTRPRRLRSYVCTATYKSSPCGTHLRHRTDIVRTCAHGLMGRVWLVSDATSGPAMVPGFNFCSNSFLLASHQGDPGSIPGRLTPDFRMWESCRRTPLVGGFFSGISRFPPPFHSNAAPYSPCFTLICSQDLAVKSRPNDFAHLACNWCASARHIILNVRI
ncbi:hypothetical protein PR048_008450 [Dryococelus australis]|uniref:Uncharacterized protein n=1 Tax=Dryococelus australis TaxID=614101 RepID=A0ABQ9HX67_9NEOP|nr:hypothetical protein PR048_008450 [Dryococelus australis]